MPESGRQTVLKSGDLFPTTGYYSYAGHADSDVNAGRCYVSSHAKTGLLFTKGETAPKFISCPHDISWKLDASYKPALSLVSAIRSLFSRPFQAIPA